ncbi:hypothetical protein BKA67DRAFT_528716 [Truncatella angustata]|uniref:Uncharacterized protein n=1 Tax=Truncatella angustata TaxID=152316 RepID=A0A9P8U7N8_9PEZI|nr:uncharacterized protein BKA67DRAFT_528716 [Truncatella angustata]KAH6638556.1 hypothetical protein BKA67DRAFT_528716 [Truncatella angustata]
MILISNPAVFRDVIQYEERHFDYTSTYKGDGSLNTNKKTLNLNGPPRPEYENAWHRLMAYQSFRVSEEELGQYAGQKSLVKLSDDSGYYMGVSVQHALHCVQRLHHYVYRDHYHPNLSETDSFALKVHTDHCLDWLRQYVQCNADTTLIPIRWAEHTPTPVVKDWGKRTCVSWEPIMEFMAARSFDPFEPGLLVHPIFGTSSRRYIGAIATDCN